MGALTSKVKSLTARVHALASSVALPPDVAALLASVPRSLGGDGEEEEEEEEEQQRQQEDENGMHGEERVEQKGKGGEHGEKGGAGGVSAGREAMVDSDAGHGDVHGAEGSGRRERCAAEEEARARNVDEEARGGVGGGERMSPPKENFEGLYGNALWDAYGRCVCARVRVCVREREREREEGMERHEEGC